MVDANVRDQLFISYSHHDEEWMNKFRRMLAPVQKSGCLEVWCDKDIEPGENWNEKISKAISHAKVALLLVSDAFLASDFIRNSELPTILRYDAESGLHIHWVLLEECLIEQTPLYQLQAAHPIKTSLAEIPDAGEQKKVIANICRQIANDLGQYSSVDRPSRLAFADKLQEALKSEIKITKEIDAGEFSFVYYGERVRDGQEVAVKAAVMSPLQSWAIDNFKKHIQKARTLSNPCFIKIFEVKLDEEPHILVMERVEGPTLRNKLQNLGRLTPCRVVGILHHIATALSEVHHAGLIYGSLRPSSMFLLDNDAIKLPAVDLSNEVVRSERMRGGIVTSYEMLTYMIPELYEGGEPNEKSDQYYLGLLALEMLSGVPPVRINCLLDFEKKREFFDDPRQTFESWRSDEPGLTRIIARMLSKNPDERWPTMASVARMLRPVEGWEDPVESLVKASYSRYCVGRTAFYKNFYSQFFRRSPDAREFFAKVSMRRQYKMLDEAVALLTNFRVGPEPTVLSRTALSHMKLGLKEKHYRDFGAAFIETLKDAGEQDEDTLNAWRCVFRRGTEYMLGRRSHEY